MCWLTDHVADLLVALGTGALALYTRKIAKANKDSLIEVRKALDAANKQAQITALAAEVSARAVLFTAQFDRGNRQGTYHPLLQPVEKILDELEAARNAKD